MILLCLTATCALSRADSRPSGLETRGNGWTDWRIVNNGFLDVSLLALVARQDDLNGKPIRMRGFLSLDDEDHALYMSRDTYEYSQSDYSVPLIFGTDQSASSQRFKGQYVLIEGTFEKFPQRDHYGMVGQIKKIRRLNAIASQPGRRAAGESR
jgi:hypothetical protein